MSSSRSSIMFEEDKDKVERELLERELAEEALRDRPCQLLQVQEEREQAQAGCLAGSCGLQGLRADSHSPGR